MRLSPPLSCVSVLIVGIIFAPSVYALSLEESVQKALQTNPELLEQSAQLTISKLRVDQAESGYKPRLNLRAAAGPQITNNDFSTSGKNKELNVVQASVVLTQPLFLGFKTKYNVASSEANNHAERLQTLTKAEQISLFVAQRYLEVLKTQEIVQLAKQNLAVHDTLYKQIKSRFDKGASDKADLTQVEGRISLAKSNHLSSLNNYQDALSNFEAIAGFPVSNLVRPSVNVDLLPKNKEEAIRIASKEHPQVQSSIQRVEATKLDWEGSKSAYMPKLDIELTARRNEDNNGINGVDNQLSAMLVMNWNLYNGGYDSSEKQIARFKIAASKNASNKVLRDVTQEIKLAYAALEATKRQRRFREEHVIFSRESRRLYKLQFDSGKRTLLDVLNTENEVFTSSTDYVESDYSYISAQYRILNATGRLLPAMNIVTPWEYENAKNGELQ